MGTRYRLLVDIDKIIKYNKSTQTFYFNHNDINPLYKPSPTYDFYKNERKTKISLMDDINTNIAQTYCSNGKHYIDNIGSAEKALRQQKATKYQISSIIHPQDMV